MCCPGQIVEAFGGKGYFVTNPAELLPVLKEALAQTVRAVMIAPLCPLSPLLTCVFV